MAVEQAAEFVLQACEAVAEAHSLGIVHRDLKPANLFCIRRPDGMLSVKVLDFGISKVTTLGSASDAAMTQAAALMGSPLYMSPEQMQSSRDVDTRTDIWALGVVIYELVSGKVPFSGETIPEICIKIATTPAPLDALGPSVPPGLGSVIGKCLEKNREERYRSVAELAVALAEFAPARARTSVERTARTIQAAGLAPGASSFSVGGPATATGANSFPAMGRTTAGLRGRKVALMSAGLAAGVLVLGSATTLVLSRRAPVTAAGSSAHAEARDNPRAPDQPVAPPVASIAAVQVNPAPSVSAPANLPATEGPLAALAPPPLPPVDTKPVDTKPVDTKPAKASPKGSQPGPVKATPASTASAAAPSVQSAPQNQSAPAHEADPFARLKPK
jgi:serine/threonine-protein kinase